MSTPFLCDSDRIADRLGEVSSLDEIPQGMVSKVVPTATYHTYSVEGDFPDTLI